MNEDFNLIMAAQYDQLLDYTSYVVRWCLDCVQELSFVNNYTEVQQLTHSEQQTEDL